MTSDDLAQNAIDVLLISPRLPKTDPRTGGDHTYTEMLLAHPPEGVRYHHYEDLLSQGKMHVHRYVNALMPRLSAYGILPPDVWGVYLVSDFVPDLLHIYGFSAYITFSHKKQRPIPVIMGQGVGGASDLLCYRQWGERQARAARKIEALIFRLLGIYSSSLNPRNASRILVWSEFSRQMHLWDRIVRPDHLEVLPPGLAAPAAPDPHRTRQGTTFLFVGRDFKRKNGYLALDAFRQVKLQHPEARLIIVGSPPDGEMIQEEGVSHKLFVPLQELYEQIYPQADVLVLPSTAEGFGLVLLQAMSFGMPVIGVDAWAMPEIVTDGETGFLVPPNSVDALVDRMSKLARDTALLSAMGKRSHQAFQDRFSIVRHNRRLRAVYDQALAGVGA